MSTTVETEDLAPDEVRVAVMLNVHLEGQTAAGLGSSFRTTDPNFHLLGRQAINAAAKDLTGFNAGWINSPRSKEPLDRARSGQVSLTIVYTSGDSDAKPLTGKFAVAFTCPGPARNAVVAAANSVVDAAVEWNDVFDTEQRQRVRRVREYARTAVIREALRNDLDKPRDVL